jgi:hypothetical protein
MWNVDAKDRVGGAKKVRVRQKQKVENVDHMWNTNLKMWK